MTRLDDDAEERLQTGLQAAGVRVSTSLLKHLATQFSALREDLDALRTRDPGQPDPRP